MKQTGKISRTVGYYGAFLILGATTAILGPTLSRLATHTHTNLGQASLIFTARALGYLLGALLGGRCYDLISGHMMLSGVLLSAGLSSILIPLMRSPWALIILVFVLGLSHGTIQVGGGTLLTWVHGRNVGPFMNGLSLLYGLGAFLAPVIVAQVNASTGDITWGYWIMAGMTIPTIIWLLICPSPAIPDGPHHPSAPRITHFSVVLLVTLLYMMYAGAEVSFGHWIAPYTRAIHGVDHSAAAYMASAFWGMMTIGRLLAIPISLRIPPRTMLVWDIMGCLGGVGIILLWPHSQTVLWIGTLSVGLSMASFFPLLLSFAGRHIPISGRVTGFFFAGAGIGGMTLPWGIGQLFERTGPQVTMAIIIIALCMTMGLLLLLLMSTSSQVKSLIKQLRRKYLLY